MKPENSLKRALGFLAIFLALSMPYLMGSYISKAVSFLFSDGTNAYNLAPGWPAAATTCTTSGTVNFNSAGYATVELDLTSTDTCLLSISGVVAGGAYVIKVKGAAGATITWPNTIDWGSVGAPTISTSGYDDVHLQVQQSISFIHAYLGGQGFSH